MESETPAATRLSAWLICFEDSVVAVLDELRMQEEIPAMSTTTTRAISATSTMMRPSSAARRSEMLPPGTRTWREFKE